MNRKEIIEYLRRFKEENKNKYHIERIGVFGSVARNTANDNSDIDIVVVLTRQDLFEIIRVQ